MEWVDAAKFAATFYWVYVSSNMLITFFMSFQNSLLFYIFEQISV